MACILTPKLAGDPSHKDSPPSSNKLHNYLILLAIYIKILNSNYHHSEHVHSHDRYYPSEEQTRISHLSFSKFEATKPDFGDLTKSFY
jgi:hypothetical protein